MSYVCQVRSVDHLGRKDTLVNEKGTCQSLKTGSSFSGTSTLYGRLGFPGGSDSKESACRAGVLGLIPGSGRCLGEGNGNPVQYSCLENYMRRGARWATVHGVEKSQK